MEAKENTLAFLLGTPLRTTGAHYVQLILSDSLSNFIVLVGSTVGHCFFLLHASRRPRLKTVRKTWSTRWRFSYVRER